MDSGIKYASCYCYSGMLNWETWNNYITRNLILITFYCIEINNLLRSTMLLYCHRHLLMKILGLNMYAEHATRRWDWNTTEEWTVKTCSVVSGIWYTLRPKKHDTSSSTITRTATTTTLHRELDMRRYPDPQHLWWQSFCSCRSRAMEQFTTTSQRCWLTLQSVPAVIKDIFVWIVGPRRSANYFNCTV